MTASGTRILVIYNPVSGRRNKARLDRVLTRLCEAGAQVTVRETGGPGDAETYAREAGNFDVVAVAGGDGTVNEALNGLGTLGGKTPRGKTPALAFIPLGTANILAHELGLPRSAWGLAETILVGERKVVRPGRANGRLFLLMVAAGFDARVVAGVDTGTKRVLGAAAYVVLEGDSLVLDGRGSDDVNEGCGDEIAEYAWDLNGDGDFDDDDDVSGARPTIEWDDLDRILEGPANRDTGEPFNTVTLRVTDSRGLTGTAQTRVTLFSARPVAIVVQNPDPSPISRRNGFSNTTLDGRESRSPVPGGEITTYSWDLDDSGDFEIEDRPVVDFIKVHDPIPNEQQVGDLDVLVRLRVTDHDNRTSQVTRYRVRFDVPPTPPTADADATDPPEVGYHILLGEDLELDGSQSSDPDIEQFDDFLRFYRWDLTFDADDGFDADFEREDANGSNQEAVSQLDLTADQLAAVGVDAAGAYTVRLQVVDSTGLEATDDAPLHVYAVNPVADVTANPNPSACRERVTLDGRGSDHPHPEVEINGYTWDLDADGQYDDANGAVVNHAFQTFGDHDVGLRVTDTNGNAGTATIEVNVDQGNRAPTAVAGGFRNDDDVVVGPYAIAVGESLQLDGLGSADPDVACGDSIANYQWDINVDGTFDIAGANMRRPAALSWEALGNLDVDAPDVQTLAHAVLGLHRLSEAGAFEIEPGRLLAAARRLDAVRRDAHWEPSWFNAYGGTIEATVTVLELFDALGGELLAGETRSIVRYLVSTRDEWGGWHNPRGTASAIRGMLLLGSAPEEVASTVTVTVDGVEVARVEIDPTDPFLSAASLRALDLPAAAAAGEHQIVVTYDGALTPSVQLITRHWDEPSAAGTGLVLTAELEHDRIAPGQATGLVVRIASESNADLPVRIDVPAPANAELARHALEALLDDGVIERYESTVAGATLFLTLDEGESTELRLVLAAIRSGEANLPPLVAVETTRASAQATALGGRLVVD